MTEGVFFRDLALLLIAAVVGGFLAQWLRQPAFVGYIAGGLLITAIAGPRISGTATFHLFAEFGVVLLMFALGVEFSLRELWKVRALALIGAPFGVAIIIGLMAALMVAAGSSLASGLVTGLALAVCSTMALAKLLEERGDLNGPVGRASIGISLAQDGVVIAAFFLIPALASAQGTPVAGLLIAMAQAAAVLAAFFLLADRLVPALLGRIAHAQNTELFVLVAVTIGIGTAALSAGLGLSLALGAFLAGLIISESEYTAETLARVLPLRDLFVAVFFVSIGMLIDVGSLLERPILLLQMVGVVLLAKVVVWTGVTLAFRSPLPVALAVGIGQTQIGEFSFVIAQLGRAAGLLSEEVYSAVLATSLVTLVVNALVFRRSRPLERWADRWAQAPVVEPAGQAPAVLIAGYGRVGSTVGEALESFNIPFAVVDFSPVVVRALRHRGIPAVLGDAANEIALREAGASGVRLTVLTIPDTVKAALATRRVLGLNPEAAVIARAHSRDDREGLLAEGATEVILPEIEAGMTLVDHALHRLAVPSQEVRTYLRRLRELERPGGRTLEGASGAALLQAATVRVVEGPLAHQSLRRTRIRERTGVTVVGVERPGEEPHWNPPPEAVLLPGDQVTVVGLLDQIERFRRVNAGTEE
ncbi:MAG: cation:proton antiporter [bacterium]|nr:cation:proton antiporter [bacterium]